MKKLPKIIYVYWYEENKEDNFLTAEDSLEGCAIKGETRLVGVYELKETKKVTLKVTEEIVTS